MPQIDVQDFNPSKIISINYEEGDTIRHLKVILESMGYKPGMKLYHNNYMLMDYTKISNLNQSDTPLVVVGDKEPLPMVPEPEPEMAYVPEPEPEMVTTTKEDEVTRLLSEIDRLNEELSGLQGKLDRRQKDRGTLINKGTLQQVTALDSDMDEIRLEIGIKQSEITQLQKQVSGKGGGKRRRRGRRKPTKSRKTKRTRNRRSLKKRSRKRRSLKKRSLKKRSLKKRSRKGRSLKRRSRK